MRAIKTQKALIEHSIYYHCSISYCDNSFISKYKMGNRNFHEPGFLLIRGFCGQNLNLRATHAHRSEHHLVQPTLEHVRRWRSNDFLQIAFDIDHHHIRSDVGPSGINRLPYFWLKTLEGIHLGHSLKVAGVP